MSNYSGKYLHLVSFNVPDPPDYGGVMDVFYKIKSLAELGVKIILHCFHYGRERSEQLEAICHQVHYYPRKKFFQAIYSAVPYIVGSRQSDELLSNLSGSPYPIIFEGLHTCFYLSHPALRRQFKVVRMHNVEWEYYRSLKEQERNYLLKFYFYYESKKLRRFEEELEFADHVLAISRSDADYLLQSYDKVTYVGAFHAHDKVTTIPGLGNYALYHGNLSVVENHQAALYLIRKIMPQGSFPLVIAGKNPLPALQKLAAQAKDVRLVANPSHSEMDQLQQQAQIHLLPTFQATGVKLKLINALYTGRHCVVNSPMVSGSSLEPLCTVADRPSEWIEAIQKLQHLAVTTDDIAFRQSFLQDHYANRYHAEKILKVIFG
jgi:hypothetical protein